MPSSQSFQARRGNAGLRFVYSNGGAYVPLSSTGAELLFEVFSQRYERGSTIVTSNLPFEDLTQVLGSERLTRRAARPAHPPREHPYDERRQLPAEGVRRVPTLRRQDGAKPGRRDHRPRNRRGHHRLIDDDNDMKRPLIRHLFI